MFDNPMPIEQISSDVFGSEVMLGTPGDDFLFALDNSPKDMYGNEGEDIMRGGSGNDTMHGGKGGDVMEGSDGDDTLFGDRNSGETENGNNIDVLIGGFGNDALFGGKGIDKLFGGDGNDFLSGDKGGDMLFGGAGNDFLDGGKGIDLLNGDVGFDSLLLRNDPGSFDIIVGFEDGQDLIALPNGLTFENLVITEAGSEAQQLAEQYLVENGGVVAFPNADGSLNYDQVSASDLLIKDGNNEQLLAVLRVSALSPPVALDSDDFISG